MQNIMFGGSSQILQGWPDQDSNNHFAVEERARGSMAIASGFPDIRTSSTSYVDITNRQVYHTKVSATSQIRVTYVDTLGWFVCFTLAFV